MVGPLLRAPSTRRQPDGNGTGFSSFCAADRRPPGAKETTMHPTIGYHLAKAHLAGLRHQAQRDTLAHAARRARRARTYRPGHPGPAHPSAARRLLAALGARTSA
jgi:hypothetical protein